MSSFTLFMKGEIARGIGRLQIKLKKKKQQKKNQENSLDWNHEVFTWQKKISADTASAHVLYNQF